MEAFVVASCVSRFHIYKATWSPNVGEEHVTRNHCTSRTSCVLLKYKKLIFHHCTFYPSIKYGSYARAFYLAGSNLEICQTKSLELAAKSSHLSMKTTLLQHILCCAPKKKCGQRRWKTHAKFTGQGKNTLQLMAAYARNSPFLFCSRDKRKLTVVGIYHTLGQLNEYQSTFSALCKLSTAHLAGAN